MPKIYTKTGDNGSTGAIGGIRLNKDDLIIKTLGEIDELNAIIGVCRAFNPSLETNEILKDLQSDLFLIGSEIASLKAKTSLVRLSNKYVLQIESQIDKISDKIIPIQNFILPSGSKPASFLHFARAVCRRAERTAFELNKKHTINKYVLSYLNRTSDLLFTLARFENSNCEITEEKWDVKP